MRQAVGSLLALVSALLLILAGCSGDLEGLSDPVVDSGFDRSFPVDDAGGVPAEGGDKTPPPAITDLALGTIEHDAVTLTWTAPTDTASYQIRYARTAIATPADFDKATSVVSQVPKPPGQQESVRVSGLAPDTAYWIAVRARDAAGNRSDLSNVVTTTTLPRATFLITEVAPLNAAADGFDFVEIVATKAGVAKGIEVRQEANVLYTLADITVAVGDRFVVHVAGPAGPAGFAQEDVTKDKTSSTAAFASNDAFDVYSTQTGITGTDNVISILDAGKTVDALAFSDRDGTASTAAMAAYAKARLEAAWTFTAAPVDTMNDCETQGEAVGIGGGDTPCLGFRTGIDNGISINRFNLTDTNTKRDFYVAAQTPGAANGVPVAPLVLLATGTAADKVEIRFDQEVLETTALAANFTVTGLNVIAATASGNKVTLTTAAQTEVARYPVTVSNAVTNFQGVAVGGTAASHFCGFSATPAVLVINEVAPALPSNADLVELRVTSQGSLSGYSVRLNPASATSTGTNLATLPTICAQAGDIVVVHMNPPLGVTAPTSEMVAKNESPSSTYSANYDDAWDVLGTTAQISSTNNVLAVRSAGGVFQDVAVFTDMTNFSAPALTSLLFFQSAAGGSLWAPADCAGAACDATTARSVAADWSTVENTPTGLSIRRVLAPRNAASWAVGPSSFGTANP